ncbi:unnamed protein product [Nyctereutes procyonoides]|uniref:(raccoon dog) hypothetical protein n=1 Tax=Nyctereutes procyonoides TaxID=34880 RepID=A0A811YI16_NYCPR|nr:unnamed protein product [Nyctereutes procyonoides]
MRLQATVTRRLLVQGEGLKGAWGRAEAGGLPFFPAEASLGAGPGASSGPAPKQPRPLRVTSPRTGRRRPFGPRPLESRGAGDGDGSDPPGAAPCCEAAPARPPPAAGLGVSGGGPRLRESEGPLPQHLRGARGGQGGFGVQPGGLPVPAPLKGQLPLANFWEKEGSMGAPQGGRLQGAWVAQSVKPLPSAQVMIPGSWDRAPHGTPCSAGSLLLPLPFPLPLAPTRTCARALSLSHCLK